ncbi:MULTISPECIES: helix-turn-helix domain-containing protein [Paenibacillaceae]|uniref:HTH cro/C1-type domain-containing protein n=2 Tax=Paenibacillaceae TaxID=186822 RepID=A0A511VBD7_9BACL|nr:MULTISPECIES: helix-turn-helix transcriptional regulator [Paenibacillaceae]MUG72719.1 helix-turn-helix domain-containing protein [Paenibacillus validus]GEN36139.1 hypothetical protein ADA01nite_35990 [Aneurinibacillus danicus]
MANSNNSELGLEIRKHLYRIGKSQKWLAEETGFSTVHVSAVINGRAKPSPEFLYKVCQALNTDIEPFIKIMFKVI